MGLLFMFVAIVVEFAIAVLLIWQANKRFGKKGLLTAISAVVALILLGYIWNCCTSWHSEAPISANLKIGAKETVRKHCRFWLHMLSPAPDQSNH